MRLAFYLLTAILFYNYYKTCTIDPGYIPEPASTAVRNGTIVEMAEVWPLLKCFRVMLFVGGNGPPFCGFCAKPCSNTPEPPARDFFCLETSGIFLGRPSSCCCHINLMNSPCPLTTIQRSLFRRTARSALSCAPLHCCGSRCAPSTTCMAIRRAHPFAQMHEIKQARVCVCACVCVCVFVCVFCYLALCNYMYSVFLLF